MTNTQATTPELGELIEVYESLLSGAFYADYDEATRRIRVLGRHVEALSSIPVSTEAGEGPDYEALGRSYAESVEAEGVIVPQEWKDAAKIAAEATYAAFVEPSGEAFEREERYIVFKKSHLSDEQLAKVERLIAEGRQSSSSHDWPLPTVECVVVERDWPEYETVWAMIEARVSRENVSA